MITLVEIKNHILALKKTISVKKGLSIALTLCALLGWWGALYPQFTLLRGTYDIVYEDSDLPQGTSVEGSGVDSGRLYWGILDADSSHIRFKSRLLMEWNALQGEGKHESAE